MHTQHIVRMGTMHRCVLPFFWFWRTVPIRTVQKKNNFHFSPYFASFIEQVKAFFLMSCVISISEVPLMDYNCICVS